MNKNRPLASGQNKLNQTQLKQIKPNFNPSTLWEFFRGFEA
jgi:hypothetical protein